MKNHKKEDNLTKNIISAPYEVKPISKNSVGNAGEDPFCVYAGMRHAVGSIITKDDGSTLICTENGSWQNT
ncbi:MAG TPA: hypothetical protein VK071_05780 [Tissierellales bacterium]|nr:hypothetical protein [Tissierellales bacterium]